MCNERACRRDSVHRGLSVARLGGHPSRRPTRGVGRAALPLLALLRVGVAEPPGSPRTLVRSYRTVSPLPVAAPPAVAGGAAHRRSALCGPIQQVTPFWLMPERGDLCPPFWLSPAPCPTESRPSSTPRPCLSAGPAPRPPGLLAALLPIVAYRRARRTRVCSRCCRARPPRACRTPSWPGRRGTAPCPTARRRTHLRRPRSRTASR